MHLGEVLLKITRNNFFLKINKKKNSHLTNVTPILK